MSELKLVDLIYRWRVSETSKRLERKLDNEFYVTDLIYCPLRYRYQKLYRELTLSAAINPVTMLGEFTHYGVEKVLSEIFGLDNVRLEVDYEKGIEVEGVQYVVKGRIDAIIGSSIVEIKTSRSDISIPQNHHILQTRIYLWLSGYKNALLLYITPSRVAEFPVGEPATDEEISNLIRETLACVRTPRYPWECGYCIYSVLCPSKIVQVKH